MHLSLFATFCPSNILVCPPNIFNKSTPVPMSQNLWGVMQSSSVYGKGHLIGPAVQHPWCCAEAVRLLGTTIGLHGPPIAEDGGYTGQGTECLSVDWVEDVGRGRSVVSSSPSVRMVGGSNPTQAATYGPWTSPSLVVVCITWCDALRTVAALRLNSTPVINCYHPFILWVTEFWPAAL